MNLKIGSSQVLGIEEVVELEIAQLASWVIRSCANVKFGSWPIGPLGNWEVVKVAKLEN